MFTSGARKDGMTIRGSGAPTRSVPSEGSARRLRSFDVGTPIGLLGGELVVGSA